MASNNPIHRGAALRRHARTYRDSDGRECSLATLCRREPEWAASRIAELERALQAYKDEECECSDCVDEQIWEPGGGSFSTRPVGRCRACMTKEALDDRTNGS